MKIFNANYLHGKLYDIESGKRIILEENAKLNVIVEEKFLLEKDPYNFKLDTQSEEDLLSSIKKRKYADYKKLAEAGDKLSFVIKAGKKGINQTAIASTFSLLLKQSLYLIKKDKNSQYGVVYGCSCVVEKETTNNLKHFEPIYAYSLNDAYMKTYDTYFALYGKPTINIYNRFLLLNGDKSTLLAQLRIWPVV